MKMNKTKSKKLFSIRYKLMLVFGLMTAMVLAITIFTSITIAREVAIEKVERHLKDKARDQLGECSIRINR